MHCKKCEHSKLDELWGEYKCLKLCHSIDNPEVVAATCQHYKEKKEKNSK